MPHEMDRTDNSEEERYIDAARRGDLAAFNWLVLRYQTRVYNLCYRMLSDPDEAADAAQEAFLSAYKAISRFKGGHFRAWVLRIASNACLDMLRSRKRKATYSLDHASAPSGEEDMEPLPIADLDPLVDPEAQALSAELVSLIQEGLDMLPHDQRIALVLVDVQGLSYDEAAVVTDTNLGTIKSRINRARSKMRDYLRESGVISPGELSTRGERSTSRE
jgi:RNA polymerase sigma-70 factor, ECF subfamily